MRLVCLLLYRDPDQTMDGVLLFYSGTERIDLATDEMIMEDTDKELVILITQIKF